MAPANATTQPTPIRSRDPVLVSLIALVGAMAGAVKRVSSVVENMDGDELQVIKPMKFRVSVSC